MNTNRHPFGCLKNITENASAFSRWDSKGTCPFGGGMGASAPMNSRNIYQFALIVNSSPVAPTVTVWPSESSPPMISLPICVSTKRCK